MSELRQTFPDLVRQHTPVAYAVAFVVVRSAADAEDVVQDAFLLAYKNIERCREPQRFRAWLLRIVRNRAYNLLEYQRVRRTQPLESANAVMNDVMGPEKKQQLDAIVVAMSGLKDEWREVLWLHEVEGFSHAEIAEALNTSEGMSRKLLMKARQRIRDKLPPEMLEDYG